MLLPFGVPGRVKAIKILVMLIEYFLIIKVIGAHFLKNLKTHKEGNKKLSINNG